MYVEGSGKTRSIFEFDNVTIAGILHDIPMWSLFPYQQTARTTPTAIMQIAARLGAILEKHIQMNAAYC